MSGFAMAVVRRTVLDPADFDRMGRYHENAGVQPATLFNIGFGTDRAIRPYF